MTERDWARFRITQTAQFVLVVCTKAYTQPSCASAVTAQRTKRVGPCPSGGRQLLLKFGFHPVYIVSVLGCEISIIEPGTAALMAKSTLKSAPCSTIVFHHNLQLRNDLSTTLRRPTKIFADDSSRSASQSLGRGHIKLRAPLADYSRLLARFCCTRLP